LVFSDQGLERLEPTNEILSFVSYQSADTIFELYQCFAVIASALGYNVIYDILGREDRWISF
jgi:hypothetical protein